MRVLLHAEDPSTVGREIGEDDLSRLYAAPPGPWLRVNMISTVDGSATGPDGRSGTINNDVDHAVFAALRKDADVVVVGAGTARAEGYSPAGVPLVLVGETPTQYDRYAARVVREPAAGVITAVADLIAPVTT